MKKNILVTGATGNFGKAAIDFLLKKGISANNIFALVRDKEKAEVLKSKGINLKIGNYDNYDSLIEAFKGIDKLLLVSGSDVVNRGKQHENAIKAAKEAGVKHIMYTSFERKNETETSPITMIAKAHIDTEKTIKASGLDYTLFRNNLYMDVLPMFLGEQVLETGIFFPAGETKSAFVLRNDLAEATAHVLATEGHVNKEYVMSNTINYSLQDVADILSKITNNTIAYTSPDANVYINTLSNAGVPMEYVGMFAGFAEAIKQGEFNTSKTDLEDLLGRKPVTLETFLRQVYSGKK